MYLTRPETINASTGLSSSNVTESEAAWNSGTTYAEDAAIYKTIDGIHQRFVSAQDSNTNHDPATDDGTWWTATGPTNLYAMFDGKVQTQTVFADEIVVEVAPAGLVDRLAVLNVSALTLQVQVFVSTTHLVFDQTYNLTSVAGIDSLYDYFFEPIVRDSKKVVTGLPFYSGVTVSVTLSDPGQDVACGLLTMGQSRYLGGTRWGAALGFIDYSVKQADSFGEYFIVERAYSETGDFDVIVQAGFVDQFMALLAQYRATPLLFTGDDDYNATTIYGFVKEVNLAIAYPDVSFLTLRIEGLT